MRRIVFLDRSTVQATFRSPNFAHVWVNHDLTAPDQTLSRIQDEHLVITNKVQVQAVAVAAAQDLELIQVAATGANNIDLAACQSSGVRVANVKGYSTDSVAEHVFSLIFALRRQIIAYDKTMQEGAWPRSPRFNLYAHPISDLAGTTLGIVGYGAIGQRVAEIARVLKMKVLVSEHKGAKTIREGRLSFTDTLAQSDVLSLHAPLNANTRDLISGEELARMKPTSLLINTGRGPLIDESALGQTLRDNHIAGAGVDVLAKEPPLQDNALLKAQGNNLIITPHVAWASQQAQNRLAEEIIENLEAFVRGEERNQLV